MCASKSPSAPTKFGCTWALAMVVILTIGFGPSANLRGPHLVPSERLCLGPWQEVPTAMERLLPGLPSTSGNTADPRRHQDMVRRH